jgi:hypothetical protein
VPWDRISALFLGGSTHFKLGPDGARAAREAKRRGLWLHMGRVNTANRARYAATIGCDSFDGSKFSRWRTTWLADGFAFAQAPPQLAFEF